MRRDASPLPARLACLASFARLACALGEAHAVSYVHGSEASETAPDGGGSACGAYRGAACDAVLMSSVLTESTGAFAVKCLVAVALGAVIGAQREFSPYLGMFLLRARRTAVAPVRRAGLRTHVLVALGSCLFTDASWSAFAVPVPARVKNTPFVAGTFNYDTARVAAQVVSGVGFLGAGTIWRGSFGSSDSDSKGSRDEVYGLTTAASLWTTAAVGMVGVFRETAFSVRVSLVVVVSACGGSADLLDALVACEGVTEARVDACGPRRDEAKRKKTRKLEKRRGEERPEPRAAENMEDMEDIEDVEDEPNAPLLFPRRRARASS